MKNAKFLEIVRLCLEIETAASQAYEKLSALFSNRELSEFWQHMSEEEKMHISFWKSLQNRAAEVPVPDIFENPDEIIADLNKIIPKANALLDRCETVQNAADAFLLAYRLEFYLLHPAFETIFHMMKATSVDENPEDKYHEHISQFVEMLEKHANLTPELELLGETLQRLWKEARALASLSATDSLTGVRNRRGFFSTAYHLAYLAQRKGYVVSLMMLDIDHFKKINDTYGHVQGDKVLKAVASIIAKGTRSADVVGRYGGEEFIIFMPDVKAASVLPVAERIRQSVADARPDGIPVTISIGVTDGTIGDDPESDVIRLIEKADANLYIAKGKGRNRVYPEA